MSWLAIAKKDFKDSIRSRTLWVIIAVFFVAIGGLTYLTVDNGGNEDALELVAGFTFLLGLFLFIPIAGLLISVKSIVGEREQGTINLLLSLPHSRFDMLVGKFLGRTGVLSAAILVGFIPAVLILLVEVDDAGLGDILPILLVCILIGTMFVGIGVGFSALVDSETQATVGGVAIFFLLYLWPFIIDEVFDLFGSSLPTFGERFWLVILFEDMLQALAPDGEGMTAASAVVFTETDPALYMQNWFAFVILAGWVLVPLVIGYLRFNRSDL